MRIPAPERSSVNDTFTHGNSFSITEPEALSQIMLAGGATLGGETLVNVRCWSYERAILVKLTPRTRVS
jgi:hypothetical protein